MHEHLLVLLKPRLQRIPVKAHHPNESGNRRLYVSTSRGRPLETTGSETNRRDRAAADAVRALLLDQRVSVVVLRRDQELRVERPLPQIQGTSRVQHDVPAEHRPHAPSHRLDMVDGHKRLRIATNAYLRLAHHASATRTSGGEQAPQVPQPLTAASVPRCPRSL